MKILNVAMSLDPADAGMIERTFQMSVSLAKAGEDVAVLATDAGLTQDRVEAIKPARVLAVPCLNKRFYLPWPLFSRMRSAVKDADIIHLMGHWSILNAIVYRQAIKLHKPYVVCPAGALAIFGRSKALKRLYNNFFGAGIIRDAAGLIAITEKEKRDFESYGADLSKITVIPNAIVPEDYEDDAGQEFRTQFGLGARPFVLFLGRLNLIKGPDLLLRAFGEISPDTLRHDLVFVGWDGGMQTQLASDVHKLGLGGRVHFLGALHGKDKSRALHAADLVVVPSRHEAMSIVVLEAGAAGTPVLLTDQCGFDEVEKIGGGLVVPASVNGLREGLLKMLEDTGVLRDQGRRLQDHCLARFTWKAIAHNYLACYERIFENLRIETQVN